MRNYRLYFYPVLFSLTIHLFFLILLTISNKPITLQPPKMTQKSIKMYNISISHNPNFTQESFRNNTFASKSTQTLSNLSSQTQTQPTTNTPQLENLQPLSSAKDIPPLISESQQKQNNATHTPSGEYIKLYGEEFYTYDGQTQKFLINNLNLIGALTQKYLRYPDFAKQTNQQGKNIVEFFLYPNGDISDLKLTSSSSYARLDKNSIKTIEIAYQDYPKPLKKTKIILYIEYILR